MRYMDIVIFIFMINLSFSILTTIGLHEAFGSTNISPPESQWQESYNESIYDESMQGLKGIDETGYMLAIGMALWTALNLLFTLIFQTILVVPIFMSLGIPFNLAVLLGAPIALIQFWGIIQFLAGRSGKQID